MLTAKAKKTDAGTMTGLVPDIVKWLPINPATTPKIPPSNDNIVASIKN
jgi:hypothetical protein